MISDVDEALRRLLRRDSLAEESVLLSFEAPTRDWAARRSGSPTVNVYLYDVREARERREVGLEPVHDDEGRVVARRPPPRHFRLSYLLTAWTARPEDEHQLLDACLSCLLRYDVLPAEVLPPALLSPGTPSYLSVAQPAAEHRKSSDVWTALGGELKPSLDVQVMSPFETGRLIQAAPLASEGPTVRVAGDEDRASRRR